MLPTLLGIFYLQISEQPTQLPIALRWIKDRGDVEITLGKRTLRSDCLGFRNLYQQNIMSVLFSVETLPDLEAKVLLLRGTHLKNHANFYYYGDLYSQKAGSLEAMCLELKKTGSPSSQLMTNMKFIGAFQFQNTPKKIL